MILLGEPYHEIAKRFNVHHKTIARDAEWWKKRLGVQTQRLRNDDYSAMDVGMTAMKLEKFAEDAYVEYAATTNGPMKARFLQTAILALTARHKCLADAGYLPKVGHEKENPPRVQISFEARFGKDAIESVFDDPKSRRLVFEAANALVQQQLTADRDILGEAIHIDHGGVELPPEDLTPLLDLAPSPPPPLPPANPPANPAIPRSHVIALPARPGAPPPAQATQPQDPFWDEEDPL